MAVIISDNFTRADSTTVGNSWVDTYSKYKIASNTLQARASIANLASTTINASASAGTNSVSLASGGTSYAAGDLVMVGRGLSTVEHMVVSTSTTTSITFTTNFVNAHSSGETIQRQQYVPLLRPNTENVRDEQVILDMAALPTSTQYLTSVYLRWQDPGNYIRMLFSWSTAFTQVTVSLFQAVNGTETGVSPTDNFTATAGYIPRWVITVYGTNPTTVNLKPFRNVSGTYSSLQTSGGIKNQDWTISTATNSAVQSAGYCGLAIASGSVNGITGFTYYDATDQSVAVNDTQADKGFSPYVWYKNGSTYYQTQHTSAYLKLKFTGTHLAFTQDTSHWQSGYTAGPVFKYSIDGSTWQYPSGSSSGTITLANSLVYGTHTCQIYWRVMVAGGTQDLWTTPASSQRITGFILDNGESFLDPGMKSAKALWFCDSLGLGPTAGDVDTQADPAANFAAGLSAALVAEYGSVAFGGQGYGSAGVSNVPQLYDGTTDSNQTWNKYFSGQSRLSAGLFSPAPTYIICQQSINDYIHSTSSATYIANIKGALTAWRTAAPNAKIIIFTAFQGNLSTSSMPNGIWTDMATAYAQYQAATPDQNCFFIQLDSSVTAGFTSTRYDGASSGTSGTADGTHPILSEEVPLIAYLSRGVFPALYPAIQKVSSNNMSGGI